jgi:hypothetical protein
MGDPFSGPFFGRNRYGIGRRGADAKSHHICRLQPLCGPPVFYSSKIIASQGSGAPT